MFGLRKLQVVQSVCLKLRRGVRMKALLAISCILYLLATGCIATWALSPNGSESQSLDGSQTVMLKTSADTKVDDTALDNLEQSSKSDGETPVIVPIISENDKSESQVSVSEVTKPRKLKREVKRNQSVQCTPANQAAVTDNVNNPQILEEPKPSPKIIESKHPDKIALLLNHKEADQGPKKETSSAMTVLSMLLKLGFVLALAYLVLLLLKWVSSRKDILPNNGNLKMVASLKVSPNSSLHVINVMGKSLLIGCGGGKVNLLYDLGCMDEGETSQSSNLFAEYLEKYSKEEMRHGPAGRIAGLLQDCAAYLRERSCFFGKASDRGVNDEG